jgi:hypothetical protein
MLIAIDNTLKAVERMLKHTQRGKLDPARCLREIDLQVRLLFAKLAEDTEMTKARCEFASAAKAYLEGHAHQPQQGPGQKSYRTAREALVRLCVVLDSARMPYATRNEAEEFAVRTKRNLEYIEEGLKSGAQVHVVTQTILSMLGLIVFPWERAFAERVRTTSLEDLGQKGWPKWQITLGAEQTIKLGQLVGHLRNAVAHSRVTFSSDSPLPTEVVVEFEDREPDEAAPNWRAHISAAELREFCMRFAHLIEATVG